MFTMIHYWIDSIILLFSPRLLGVLKASLQKFSYVMINLVKFASIFVIIDLMIWFSAVKADQNVHLWHTSTKELVSSFITLAITLTSFLTAALAFLLIRKSEDGLTICTYLKNNFFVLLKGYIFYELFLYIPCWLAR